MNISTISTIFLALAVKHLRYTIMEIYYEMTRIAKNHKIMIVLALATALVGNTIATASVHMTFAHNGNHIKVFKNKGINKQTDTNQKQKCETTAPLSPIAISGFPGISGQGSCTRISSLIPFFIPI
ncbi:MAG: hypothetical protein WAM14_12225 [Candidatus Nitrosopolaris sp.]